MNLLSTLKKLFRLKNILIFIIIFFCVLFISFIWLNIYISSFWKDLIYNNSLKLEKKYIWFILWASVHTNWELSDMLKDRVDSAILAYKDGKFDRFLVSGDNGSKSYDEVTAVKKYLLRAWISDSIIYLDYAWFDTYDSIYRAQKIFWVKEMIIFTQSFHLPRSLYMAHKIWIDAIGFASDRHEYASIYYYIFRESLADIKAFIDVDLLHSRSKYLWEPIQIK